MNFGTSAVQNLALLENFIRLATEQSVNGDSSGSGDALDESDIRRRRSRQSESDERHCFVEGEFVKVLVPIEGNLFNPPLPEGLFGIFRCHVCEDFCRVNVGTRVVTLRLNAISLVPPTDLSLPPLLPSSSSSSSSSFEPAEPSQRSAGEHSGISLFGAASSGASATSGESSSTGPFGGFKKKKALLNGNVLLTGASALKRTLEVVLAGVWRDIEAASSSGQCEIETFLEPGVAQVVQLNAEAYGYLVNYCALQKRLRISWD